VAGDATLVRWTCFLAWSRRLPSFREWEPDIVPGILQTEAYAEVIMRADRSLSDEEVELRVKTRINRQSLLLNRYDMPSLSVKTPLNSQLSPRR